MLSRAVLSLARHPRILSSPLRTSSLRASFSTHHTLWYAKNNNRSRQPFGRPDFSQSPKAEQPNRASGPEQEEQEDDQVGHAPNAEKETSEPKHSLHDLHDLLQGIPSTLEAEAKTKHSRASSLNLTENPSQDDEFQDGSKATGDGAGRDKPREGYVSSVDRKRALMAKAWWALTLLAGVGGIFYYGRDWTTEEDARRHPEAPSGLSPSLFYKRIKARMMDLTSYYKDPPFQKLLPDEDPQFRQPYTLVISLEDLLVHSEWGREHGWRLAKRPGVDYFLRYLNQYYELVLFTTVPSVTGDQVLRKLDPYRIIRWPLFREATKYKDGEYVKVFSREIYRLRYMSYPFQQY